MQSDLQKQLEKEVGLSSRDGDQNELVDSNDDSQPLEAKKAKLNSLDSDEEDEHEIEKEKYNVADAETDRLFDGQEKATIAFDGETKITAFNMEEEMQEGYFDKEGTFIFRKEHEELKDSWLDNIDWVKVKEREKSDHTTTEKGLADSSDSESDNLKAVDLKAIYAKMLEVMRPGENVLRCIKRLGGERGGSRNNRKERKKLDAEQQLILDRIVGCANDVLATGDMDIYQRTYEQLQLVLTPKKNMPINVDMFAGDDAQADRLKNAGTPTTSDTKRENEFPKSKVMWEYKWDEKDDSQVYGPYSSEDMLAWSEQGYFGEGVHVRKVNENKFYSSKRIDFDLYI